MLMTVSLALLNQMIHRYETVYVLFSKTRVVLLKIFNELIKPKTNKKNLKLFGTSLRYNKHISGSITHLSNKQKRKKKCQEPIAKSSNQLCG